MYALNIFTTCTLLCICTCIIIILCMGGSKTKTVLNLSAIKCQVYCIKNTAWWLTNTVQLHWLVCDKQAHHPCMHIHFYMDLSFLLVTVYCYAINDHHRLCIHYYVVQIHHYTTSNILHLIQYSWGNKLSLLFCLYKSVQIHHYCYC